MNASLTPSDVLDTLTTGVVLAALAAGLGYAAVCTLWPYGICRRCYGASRMVTRRGRAVRHCRRCRGTGLRLRVGRRLWNRWSRFRHARREAQRRADVIDRWWDR